MMGEFKGILENLKGDGRDKRKKRDFGKGKGRVKWDILQGYKGQIKAFWITIFYNQ